MLLYHGSNISIDSIDLDKCKPNKDFGKGFYLTELEDQAILMAKRVTRIFGGTPVLNIFCFEESELIGSDLRILNFGRDISEDWARFVMNNRNKHNTDIGDKWCNKDNKYDIVIGPVANDDMALLFRQFENEIISFEMLMNGMKYRKSTNQYSFHTDRATVLLKKVGEKNDF